MKFLYWCVDVVVVACFVEIVMQLSIHVMDDEVLIVWCLRVHLVCGTVVPFYMALVLGVDDFRL